MPADFDIGRMGRAGDMKMNISKGEEDLMAADKKEVNEKPLDKMTVKELREVAKEIPEITGVHGMNKGDLLAAVKKAKGIKEAPKKKPSASTKELKVLIKALKTKKAEAQQAKDRQKTTIYRRKISRLKKKSRRAA